jgi:hypothetical protein
MWSTTCVDLVYALVVGWRDLDGEYMELDRLA